MSHKDCAVRPNFWRPHLNLSLALGADGDMAGAEAELDRALELAPEMSGMWFRRGALRESQGRFDEALADFNTAIRLAPRDGNSYYNRGLLLLNAGHFREAIDDCTRSIELDPGNYQAYSVLQKAQAGLKSQHRLPQPAE